MTHAGPVQVDAVVIGTSAGGVVALLELLPALPADFAGAIFVVLHLPRERPSLLVDVFAPRCALRVLEGEDKMPVMPGTVYFAPPDYHLLIDDGPELSLSADPPVLFSRPSIDVLFESAADVYGAGLMGIILTGASEDGAAGLDAVHRHGGITIVQDPATAAAPFMTEAAIQRSPHHQVMGLADIAGLLRRLTAKGRHTPD